MKVMIVLHMEFAGMYKFLKLKCGSRTIGLASPGSLFERKADSQAPPGL